VGPFPVTPSSLHKAKSNALNALTRAQALRLRRRRSPLMHICHELRWLRSSQERLQTWFCWIQTPSNRPQGAWSNRSSDYGKMERERRSPGEAANHSTPQMLAVAHVLSTAFRSPSTPSSAGQLRKQYRPTVWPPEHPKPPPLPHPLEWQG
jgi:hypothetical protein